MRGAAGSGYGWLLLRTLLVLALVLLLAYVVIRFGLRRLNGTARFGTPGAPRLEVLERRNLDARSAVFAVRAGSRVFLVGSGEAGVRLLSELPAADWGEPDPDASEAEAAASDTEGAP